MDAEEKNNVFSKWLKAQHELNEIKLENRRRLEEIESLRRQREIFRLNYSTEVTSHICVLLSRAEMRNI